MWREVLRTVLTLFLKPFEIALEILSSALRYQPLMGEDVSTCFENSDLKKKLILFYVLQSRAISDQ